MCILRISLRLAKLGSFESVDILSTAANEVVLEQESSKPFKADYVVLRRHRPMPKKARHI